MPSHREGTQQLVPAVWLCLTHAEFLCLDLSPKFRAGPEDATALSS